MSKPNHDFQDSKKEPKEPSLITENSKISLIIPVKKAREIYNKILTKLAKNVKAEGFRKGKVPNKIAEERIGVERLINETLQELLPNLYTEEIKKQNKQPLTNPEFKPLSLNWEKDWEIEAYFPEPPVVSLGKYQDIIKKAKKGVEKGEKKEDKSKKPELTKDQERELTLQHIFRDLVMTIKPPVPELLLRYETKTEYDKLQANLKQVNLSVDKYLEQRKVDQHQLTNELATTALGRLQLDFILGAIAKEAKLSISQKEIDTHLAQIKDQKAVENLKKDPQYLAYLETALIKQKVVNHLLDS